MGMIHTEQIVVACLSHDSHRDAAEVPIVRDPLLEEALEAASGSSHIPHQGLRLLPAGKA